MYLKSPRSIILITGVLVVGLLVGLWLGRNATVAESVVRTAKPVIEKRISRESPLRSTKFEERSINPRELDRPAQLSGAIQGQRSVTFGDRGALDDFLKRLEGTGIEVIGRIDQLNTLRIRFDQLSDLENLLTDGELGELIFPVTIPGEAETQEGLVGLGNQLLEWVGLQDAANLGKGVTIAVLDTGVFSDEEFGTRVRNFNLAPLPRDISELNGHGTAVASIAAGTSGISPEAKVLAFRVADDSGTSDTFQLAAAILQAVEAGADLINLSMGSRQPAILLQRSIEIAQQAGVLVIASAGNDGRLGVSYPANYAGVISVAAVDATGSHLGFSNRGRVSISAPGLDVGTTGSGNRSIYFSGTSASAPIVTGALAGLMSTHQLTANQAWERLLANSDEAGAPGIDPLYGAGILNPRRAYHANSRDRSDVAVSSNYVTSGVNGPELLVTFQNHGTTAQANIPATVTTPAGRSMLSIPSLLPSRTHTFRLPFVTSSLREGEPFRIDSQISLPGSAIDRNPANNRRIDVYVPPTR